MEQPRPIASRAPLGARSVNTISSQDAAAGRSSSASSSLLMAKINAMRARENVKTQLAAQSDYPTPPPSSQSPPHSQASRYSASPSTSASPLTPATKKASSSAYKRDRPLLSPAAPAAAILSTSNDDSPNPRMKKRADERPTPNRRPLTAQRRYESDADDDDDDDAQGPSNSPRRSKTASSSNSRRVLDLMSIRSDPVHSEAAANASQSMDNSNSSSSMRRSGRKRTQAPGKGIAAALAPAPPRDTSMRSSASAGRRSATPRQPTPTTSTRQSVQPVVRATAPAAPAPAVESDPESSDPNELFESSDEEFDAQQPILAKPQARRGRVSTSQPLPSTSSKSRNAAASRRSAPPARRRATSGQLTKTPANSHSKDGKRRAATTMKRPPPIGPRDKLSPFVPRPASPSDDPLLLKPREWERMLRRDEEEENYEDGEVNDTFAAAAAGRSRRRAEEQQQQRAATTSTSASEPRASLLDPDFSEHEYSCGQVDSDQEEVDEVSDNERETEAAEEAGARSFSSDFSRLAAEMRADLGRSVAEDEETSEKHYDAFDADVYGGDSADFAGYDDGYGYLDAAAGVSDDDSDEDVRASHGIDDDQAAEEKADEHMPEDAEASRNEADVSAEGVDDSMAEGVIADGTWPEEEEQSGATEAAIIQQEELQEDAPVTAAPTSPRHVDNASIRDEEEQSHSEDEAADSLELSQEPPSEEQEPALAVSERQPSVDVDERDAAEAEQTLNGFANMSVTQDEEEDEDEDEDEVLAEDPFLNAAAGPVESTPARTTTASTAAQPNLFSQSVILPSPSTTTAGITMAQRSHSHLESDSMRSMMHSLPRPTPIVEVMSSDPQAAARAAAILRMHHKWIHEGSLTTTTGADGGETFIGNVLAGLDESATRGEDELPQMLKDAEAELARMGLKEGSSQAQIAASPAPAASASPAPEAAAVTPLANQTLSAPTPKIPGAWSWSPLSFLAPAPSASSSRASTRPPTPVNDIEDNNSSPLSQALQSDPTNFPRSAWKALERTVRSMVREEVKSSDEAEQDEQQQRRRQAYLHLSRTAVVDHFLRDNTIDPSLLRDRWSRRNLERSVVALQRQYFARLEREQALTEEETAFLAAEGASSRAGSISIFSAAPSDLTTMSSLQTPMSSISRVAAVASVAQPAAASPSPLMMAALASHSTPVARSTPTAEAANKAVAPTPLPPPSPIATPAQPSPSPAVAQEREEEDVADTPVQQRAAVDAVPATPVQQQGSAEAAPGSVSRWSLKKRLSQIFSRGEQEAEKEREQEPEAAPAPQQSTEPIAPATPSPTAVAPDVEQVNPSRPSTPSIYPALPSPSTFNAAPPPPPEPTASDLSVASARQHRASTASSPGRIAPRRSRSSTAADESCGSDSSLLAQEAAAAAAVMAQKRQLNRASRTTGLVTESATSPGGKGGNTSMSTSAWVSPRALRQARASQGKGQGQQSPLRRSGSSKATVSAAVDKYTSRASTSTTSLSPSHARARSSLSLSHRSTSFIRPTMTTTNFSPPRRTPGPAPMASRNLGFTGSSRSAGSSFVRPTVLAGLGDDSHASARLKAQALSKAREQQTWLSPLAKRRRAEREAMKRGTGGRGTDQIAQAVAEEARRRKSGAAGMSSSFLLARKQREADETAALSVGEEQEQEKENSFDSSSVHHL